MASVSEFELGSETAHSARCSGANVGEGLRRVLLIAYYFPPSVDVGAKRAEGFFRHLPEFGYQPIILTVKNGNYLTVPGSVEEERADVVRVAERQWPGRLRKRTGAGRLDLPRREGRVRQAVKRGFREIFYVPDAYHGFHRPASQRALEIIGRQSIDVIFTTSGPYTLLRVGHDLNLRTGIPWVADFRDLWVENHFGYPYSRARRLLDSFLQTRWLSNACRITTATQGLKARLQASGFAGKPIDCIYNGYLEMPPGTPPNQDPADPGTLRICFTGKLYEHPTHTVTPLFEALARIRESRLSVFRALRLDFYGIVNSDFAAQIERLCLHEVVHYHGMVSRQEAVRAQAAADVLYLPVPDTQEQEVVVCSKTFEYMANRKPLLAIVPKAGENARVLNLAGMERIFSPDDTEKMAEYLSELQASKERLGRLTPRGDPRVIEEFGYRRLTGRLVEILDAVSRPGSVARKESSRDGVQWGR